MLSKSFLILTGMVCLLAVSVSADKRNTAKFSKLICKVHDKVLISNSSCRVKPVSRYQSLMTVYGHFAYKVNDLLIKYQLFKRFSVYRPFLVNVTENFCHFFTKRSSTPYLNIFMPIVAQYTSANHSCPYEGDFLFKDLPMDAEKLRGFWPSGEYRLDVDVYINKQLSSAASVSIFLEMKENM